jgi:xylulokinase
MSDRDHRDLLCAVDVGTTAVKASVFTLEGEPVATAYREHTLRFPGPDRVEQRPEVLGATFDAALAEAVAGHAERIAAVAVTSARASFIGVDESYRPLGEVIIWQDRRSLAECTALRERIDPAAYFEITGLPLEPVAVGSKIVWLRDHEPAIYRAAHRWWTQQTWFLHRLGAVDPPVDYTMAGYYGLLDVRSLQWSERVLEAFGIDPARLPRLAQAGTVVGAVSSGAAARTGLRAGTPLVLPGSDAGCCWLGAGVQRKGQVAAYVGTAAALVSFFPEPLIDPSRRLTCLPYTLPRTWTLEGLLLSAGAAWKWFRDALSPLEVAQAAASGEDPYDLLTAQAASVPPGANGVLAIPTFVGAGAPVWEPNARGMFLGLGLNHTRADMARAVLEGVALELRNALEEMRRLGVPVSEVILTGGGSRSPLWNQIHADVHGVPVATLAVSDPTSLGAAACAGVGVGCFPDLTAAVAAMSRPGERYDPDPARHALYSEMLEVYRAALAAFGEHGIHDRLAAIARRSDEAAPPA